MAPSAELEEAQPLTPEEEAVYVAMCRCSPPGAVQRCDPELTVKCIRGYKKEKPRVEKTAEELLRIQDWREKEELDLMLTKHLPKEAEFNRGWPTSLYGEDSWGHVVFVERIEDIDTEFMAQKLTVSAMLDLRAQVFEALCLEKEFVSRRRGYRVYKHISVVDLKNLKMSHFSKDVRNVIKAIIGLGSEFYPESLWKLYLLNAPMIFRTVWAVIKPMVHPETLAKTFILGGEKDFLPILTREGLPLESVPAVCGGKHPGTPSTELCNTAIAFCSAAARRYPTVAPADRVRVALANLKPETLTMAAAAAELTALADREGPASDFVVPPKRVMPDPGPPQAPTASRRGSFDIGHHLGDLRRMSKGPGSGQSSPQRPPRGSAAAPPPLALAASRAAAALGMGQASPGGGGLSRSNSFNGEGATSPTLSARLRWGAGASQQQPSPPGSPRSPGRPSAPAAAAPPESPRPSPQRQLASEGTPPQAQPDAGRASASLAPPPPPRRRRRGFFASCCGGGGADEDEPQPPQPPQPQPRPSQALARPSALRRADSAGSRGLPRLSEVSAHAERSSSVTGRGALDDDGDDDAFFDPRDDFSVYSTDNED